MAAEQLTDKENQFKKRARRRLVGAVALVLLMITVLPLVLDDRSGQKTPQPEIAISIPSQDSGDFNSKIIPVAAPAAAKPPVQMASPLDKPEGPKIVADASKSTEPSPSSEVVDKAKRESVVQAAPESAAPAKLTASASSKPASEAPKKIDESKTKETKLAEAKPIEPKPAELKASETQSAARKGTVSVQIGVFSDAAKVKQLRAKIAEKDIQCYTENLQTANGMKIRLRCGPFPSKPEAQQALEHIKTAGFDGILVTNQ